MGAAGEVEAGQLVGIAAQRRGHKRGMLVQSWPLAWSGKPSRTRPATATTSHSRPLAPWTVSTWTRSGATSTVAGFSPYSSCSAALR